MYLVSENFLNQILGDNREFSVALTFNSSTELTGTTIQSISVDEVVNSTDALTLGCACSNKIVINLINAPTDIDYENSSFIAKVSLKLPTGYEDVPLGKFYVTEAKTSNDFKNLTITAYDGFCKMTDKYNATVSANTTLQAVYDDLRTQIQETYGITLKEQTLPEYPLTFPYLDITHQQAIGYMAGCLGGFARFDRLGELEITSYATTDISIDRNIQYMNGFKRLTDKPLAITSITTGTKDNAIVRGDGANGTVISFENPYITDTMADSVYDKFNGFTYTPCQLKWRGNPAIQAGDIVFATDKNGDSHTVFVMSQNIKIDGGLNSTIECKGKSETTSNFSNNFESAGQKIDRVYKELEQAILDATNSITGNKGGYVILYDSDGDRKPDELLIMDLENIEIATKVWRWNKEGLGYAENPNGNAYRGPYRTAITADGQINADFITTGLLNAELIRIGDEKFGDYIHIEDGVIRFGNAENPMSLKLGAIPDRNKKDYKKIDATFSLDLGGDGVYVLPLIHIAADTKLIFGDPDTSESIQIDILDTVASEIPDLIIGETYRIIITSEFVTSVELEVAGKVQQLAFYNGDTRIAYFSSNSFEIENLTEGKIRFQNFGFIPRASGNLTFTKLT